MSHGEARGHRAEGSGRAEKLSCRGKVECGGGGAFKKPILEKYEREGSYLYSTARLWDDGVICYKDTRKVLGLSLYSCLQQGED